MSEMTKEHIQEAIEKGIAIAMDAQIKDFYVDREEHYLQHQFLKEFIRVMQTSKRTANRVIVTAIVGSIIMLIVYGFWQKIEDLFK